MKSKMITPYIRRFLLIIFASSVIFLALTEITFLVLDENDDRQPTEIELLIPAGTAEKVAAGQEVTSIPAEMVFVLGDVLIVNNQDTASHELGPVFVPPGSSARLVLDEADQYAVSCSFRPSRYLGLTIIEPTNFLTRLEGLLFAVPATVVVVFLYSLVAKPIKLAEGEDGQEDDAANKVGKE